MKKNCEHLEVDDLIYFDGACMPIKRLTATQIITTSTPYGHEIEYRFRRKDGKHIGGRYGEYLDFGDKAKSRHEKLMQRRNALSQKQKMKLAFQHLTIEQTQEVFDLMKSWGCFENTAE